jgi:hypothetical protein
MSRSYASLPLHACARAPWERGARAHAILFNSCRTFHHDCTHTQRLFLLSILVCTFMMECTSQARSIMHVMMYAYIHDDIMTSCACRTHNFQNIETRIACTTNHSLFGREYTVPPWKPCDLVAWQCSHGDSENAGDRQCCTRHSYEIHTCDRVRVHLQSCI